MLFIRVTNDFWEKNQINNDKISSTSRTYIIFIIIFWIAVCVCIMKVDFLTSTPIITLCTPEILCTLEILCTPEIFSKNHILSRLVSWYYYLYIFNCSFDLLFTVEVIATLINFFLIKISLYFSFRHWNKFDWYIILKCMTISIFMLKL